MGEGEGGERDREREEGGKLSDFLFFYSFSSSFSWWIGQPPTNTCRPEREFAQVLNASMGAIPKSGRAPSSLLKFTQAMLTSIGRNSPVVA